MFQYELSGHSIHALCPAGLSKSQIPIDEAEILVVAYGNLGVCIAGHGSNWPIGAVEDIAFSDHANVTKAGRSSSPHLCSKFADMVVRGYIVVLEELHGVAKSTDMFGAYVRVERELSLVTYPNDRSQ